MASLRLLVAAVTTDAISTRNIRLIDQISVVNLWASAVTVTDQIGLALGSVTLMDPSTMNVSAAALGLIQNQEDQLIFNLFVGPDAGDLILSFPTVGTSCIFLLSVEPVGG